MSSLFNRILRLIAAGEYEYSEHAVRKLTTEGILIERLVQTAPSAIVVEEYPDYHAGPCVLCLQFDELGRPIHLLWGIPRDSAGPVTLVTAYKPDSDRWSPDFMRRRKR